jgi:hypothetical protein
MGAAWLIRRGRLGAGRQARLRLARSQRLNSSVLVLLPSASTFHSSSLRPLRHSCCGSTTCVYDSAFDCRLDLHHRSGTAVILTPFQRAKRTLCIAKAENKAFRGVIERSQRSKERRAGHLSATANVSLVVHRPHHIRHLYRA